MVSRNKPGVLTVVLVLLWTTLTWAGTLSAPDQRAIPLLRAPGSFLASGVVVGRGTILTAGHSNTQSVVHVFLPGGVFMGHPICQSQVADLGVLSAELPRNTPVYSISTRAPRPGERLTIAGWPGGRWAVVQVMVMGYGMTKSNSRASSARALFTTLAPGLGKGMSGGAVLDAQGKLVAIHSGLSLSRRASIEFALNNGLGQCAALLDISGR